MPTAPHGFLSKSAARFRDILFVSMRLLPVFLILLLHSPSAVAAPPWLSSSLLPSLSTLTLTSASGSTITLASSSSRQATAHKTKKKPKPAVSLFDLSNLNGQRVTDADLRGKPVVVVFGYTFCPDACPTGLQNLSHALDLMGESSDKVHAVFITLDPQRDTEAKLKEYLINFHPSIIGLRGTPEQVAAAAKALHIAFSKAESVGNDDYEMDYSPVLIVIDANGRIAETLDEDRSPDDLLKALQKYIPPAK